MVRSLLVINVLPIISFVKSGKCFFSCGSLLSIFLAPFVYSRLRSNKCRAQTEEAFTVPDAFFAACCAAMAVYFVGAGDFQRATLLFEETTRLSERLIALKKKQRAQSGLTQSSPKTPAEYVESRLLNGIDIINLYQLGLLWSTELCLDRSGSLSTSSLSSSLSLEADGDVIYRMDAIATFTRIFELITEYYTDPAREVPYYTNILIARVCRLLSLSHSSHQAHSLISFTLSLSLFLSSHMFEMCAGVVRSDAYLHQ
jgi:hypothetical protein